MSGWMKVNKTLIDEIRFRRVVRKLRDSNALRGVTDGDETITVTIVLGALVRFWAYADTHIDDSNALGMTLDEINELVGVDGFAQALPTDWLKVIDPDNVQLPDFVEHNGGSEKVRRDTARRQAAYRHRHKSHNVTRDVTDSNARHDARQDKTIQDKTRPEEKKEPMSAEPTAVEFVFSHWQSVWGHATAKLDDKRRKVIKAALRNYSEADLCQCISGYQNSPHHTGQNDRATVYDSIELFLRDSKHIDAGLKFYTDPPRSDLSEATRRTIAQTEEWQPPEIRLAAN